MDGSESRTPEPLTGATPPTEYVVGFLFCRDSVLLVRKTHPQWQDGLLNGPGGKVDRGEQPVQAMAREFLEETGVAVPPEAWRHFCVERGEHYVVHFYRGRVRFDSELPKVPEKNDVGELLGWIRWRALLAADYGGFMRVVGNLRWLIPMALDWRDFNAEVAAVSDIRTKPTW